MSVAVASTEPPLRVLVVDDEPLAREDIIHLLGSRKTVSVVGTCASGTEAVRAARELKPDVLLLDIRMPGLDGFGVVAQLEREEMPYVVFVTAFDRFAIDAFRVGALDYLLKPVQPAHLDDALSRARKQLRTRATVPTEANRYWKAIHVRVGIRDIIVRVDDIDWVEADTYYARLHVKNHSYLLRERMHVLEERLDPKHFTRVHRSAIVNLNRVREIVHDGRGDHIVVLSTGVRVKTSHQRWPAFRDLMRHRALG